ncbi:methyltransferase domain-containing protein [Pseudanabaena galeata UHCC 0370]|uniref:Methyltransferase domain-containing protein n=1 Tax=Pseudanabaena galeata UHCC 0370 TaxID=3110310 RepID=A0ABU5TM69_9CYAN|nr:methyltransferase domain-containing protein [Pseudanabaena galeata]MEA5479360.1 methyltransferase domain-containing protein [Pseudanabaena galeata UHCC 0370]
MPERNNNGTDMDRIKYALGLVLAKLFPKKADEIRKNFTIPNYHWSNLKVPIVDRLIRFYLGYKIKKQEGKISDELESIHRNFWSNADTYFANTKNRTEEVHIPAHKDIVQRLIPLLVDKNIQSVYEFGTGDGRWLNYLSQQWTVVKKFIGIDISERQVEDNNRKYSHLTFVRSDLIEWTEKNATHNTLYHTCGGVLEYLSEESVKRLIKILRNQAKDSIIFFIEPLYGNYDINKDITSEIIGQEYSYTHNYVHLLESAGFEIISHDEKEVGYLGRMLIVLAYNK